MKKGFIIAYSVIGVSLLASFVPLAVWAGSDASSLEEVVTKKAELKLTDSVRNEYIVEEEFDPSGISFVYDGKEISVDGLKVNYNFASAGSTAVEFIKEEGNTQYRAILPVEVFRVRHFDLRNHSVVINEDGSVDTSNLIVWAELDRPAYSFPKPAEFPGDRQTVAILNEKQYKVDVSKTATPGIVDVRISCGATSTSFKHYEDSDYDPERMIFFTNQSSNADKLVLFVESNSNNFVFPQWETRVEASGKYEYQDSEGNKSRHEFRYLKEAYSWDSQFISHSVDASVNDYYDSATEGYKVEINGTTFFVGPEEWHKAILGA